MAGLEAEADDDIGALIDHVPQAAVARLEAEAEDDLGALIDHVPAAAVAVVANNPLPHAANAAQAPPMQTISKRRGDVVIDAQGNEWLKHKVSYNGTKQYWRCRHYHTCAVRGTSEFGLITITPSRADVQHTHDDSPATITARALQGAVRDKALQYRDSSNAAIVDHVTRGMPDAVAQRIKRQNLLRVANNAKRGHGADQVNKPADEIEFTEAYSTTAAGEHFLLYDSRHPEAGQPPIVIFASATGIQSLRGSRDWGSDGTFHVAPPQFDSLCTVHAMRGDHSLVCAAYMLLPDRTAPTYLRALRALVRVGQLEDAAPVTIMTDFEAAAIKAWRAVFPNARMRGCLFHFSQALWRNIASKGLTLLYRGCAKAKELLRCFAAMAFVHPNDVLEAFNAIVAALQTSMDNGEVDATYEPAVLNFCDYVRYNCVRR